MQKTLLILLCTLLSSWAFADEETAKAHFSRANELYAAKKYEKAIEEYQAILDLGLENENLHYNLGNAFFKTNQLGKAILHFEKAKKLGAGFEDLTFNLEKARLEIVDEVTPIPVPFYEQGWNKLAGLFNAKGWAAFQIVALILLLSLLSLRFFKGSSSLPPLASNLGIGVFTVLLLVSIFAGNTQNKSQTLSNQAVILAVNSYVKSAPDANSTDLFVIHEGLKVGLTDEVGTWVQIRLADGKKGWVKKEVLEVI